MKKITTFIKTILMVTAILFAANSAKAVVAVEYDGTTYICDMNIEDDIIYIENCTGIIGDVDVVGESGGGGDDVGGWEDIPVPDHTQSTGGGGTTDQQGGNYRVDIKNSINPIKDILRAIQKAKLNNNFNNLFDILFANTYATGYYNQYSEIFTINGYRYKLRITGYDENVMKSYYDIHQAGFGYLDRFSKYAPNSLYNDGYYQGLYITGYENNYLITIGTNTKDGYEYLKNLYHSYDY